MLILNSYVDDQASTLQTWVSVSQSSRTLSMLDWSYSTRH